VHCLQPVRVSGNGRGKLIVRVDERFGECGVEVAQNVQNLERSILTARSEVDFMGITRRGSEIRLLGGSVD
jgi:hypothetical protein